MSRRPPAFRGRGRLILLLDALLTDETDPGSYSAIGELRDVGLMVLDLRAWGQKFAFYYGEWEVELIRAIKRLYVGGDFVDVGSSLGLYSIALAPQVHAAGSRVISIEPLPLNYERQRENLRLNGINHVVDLHTIAAGDHAGEVSLRFDALGADNNAIVVPSDEGAFGASVIPLDDLLAYRDGRRVGMMKIDVEGFEPKVIEGARGTIERDLPCVLAEFNRERMAINGFSIESSWQLFGRLGYRCFVMDQRESRLVVVDEPAALENLIFVPPGYPSIL